MSGGLLVAGILLAADAALLVAATLIRLAPLGTDRHRRGAGSRAGLTDPRPNPADPRTGPAGRGLRLGGRRRLAGHQRRTGDPRPRPADRWPRSTGRRTSAADRPLRPTELALLRSGPAAAVVTALVLLHARAAVDAAAPGTVRRSGGLPRGCDPLARLVYESLARPGGPHELVARRRVRDGLAELSAGLAGAGLVLSARRRLALRAVAAAAALLAVAGVVAAAGAEGGHRTLTAVALVGTAVPVAALALLPARTAAGRRLVRRLRWRLAHLAPEHEPDAAEWSPQVLGLAVALHGAAALRLTFPRFAAQGGLLVGPPRRSDGGRRPDEGRRPGARRGALSGRTLSKTGRFDAPRPGGPVSPGP